jgi:hypothetical protein
MPSPVFHSIHASFPYGLLGSILLVLKEFTIKLLPTSFGGGGSNMVNTKPKEK